MANRWTWTVVNRMTNRVQLVHTDNEEVPSGPEYERHVLPYNDDGDMLSFGAHEFTRNCFCRPRIDVNLRGDVIVIHEDRKTQ